LTKARFFGRWPILAACALAVTGCVLDPPPSAYPQIIAEEEIVLPPAPARPLTVGIYNCIDTTGQRRPTGFPQELSTAVPLDCTPYLIEAVDSLSPGYVFLVERQHVDVLLRERQLATLALNAANGGGATAANGNGTSPARRLSTLRVAEVLLVGQVVAYDRATRQITGGGALGGTGASGTIVTDLVTFSLRAVAVQSGEVLGQTTVTKSITSMRVGGHITRIFTAVMETELGGAANEPVGLALRSAVRGALSELIKNGIEDGWWA
jgi:curli production assembly/transport component CsgG